jgi:DNA-directed RNA polymerase specialized sigma54-like protein
VEIAHASSTTVLPVQLLLRSDDDLKRYEVIRSLNELLLLEVRAQHAFSDSEFAGLFARRIPGGVSRRVIAKYREEAEIPPASTRRREYANGRRKPFAIHCDWEIWLRAPED